MLSFPVFAKLELRSDRKSTRLNSSHLRISYAVFCLHRRRAEDRSGGRGEAAEAVARAGARATPAERARRVRRWPGGLVFFLMSGGPGRFPLFPRAALSP